MTSARDLLPPACAFVSSLALLGSAATAVFAANSPRQLRLNGDLTVHDPALIRHHDLVYLFCTASSRRSGGIIPIHTSPDLTNWTRIGYVFETLPAWATNLLPRARGAWAPDVAFFNGRYHLYYSVSTFGRNDSAIGLATNATLDPHDPDYHWIDQGLVVRSTAGKDDWNAIDPQLVVEDEQSLWLAWGSFWSGIKMRRIDPSTGRLSSQDTTLHSLAGRPRDPNQSPPQVGAIEAPTLVKRDHFWYLFASFDFCCRGTNSTYNVRVGRAARITGPFLDRSGIPMLDGGGTIVIEATTPRWRGPGHQTVFRDRDGTDYLVFHAYHGETGRAELKISTLEWVDGWPAAAPLP
jgi:arabinan endo-1,5-alpha-L-arabinosidase